MAECLKFVHARKGKKEKLPVHGEEDSRLCVYNAVAKAVLPCPIRACLIYKHFRAMGKGKIKE